MLAMRDTGSRELSPVRAALARGAGALALGGVLATLLAALAGSFWPFELITHFRVQLLGLLAVLLAVFLLARRWRWALLVAIAAALNGVPIRAYLLPVAPDPDTGLPGALAATGTGFDGAARDGMPAAQSDIRVVSANVLARNRDATALIGELQAARPDVFAVLELTAAYERSLAAFAAAYPHQVLHPQSGSFGIAVYSRWPIVDYRLLQLEGFAAIDAQIAAPAGEWHLVAAHLLPPMSAQLAAGRNAQLRSLARHVRTLSGPVVVVGDFNLTPYSPWFADFLERTQLHSALRGRGPQWTWPSFLPLLGIPIDHVLVSRDLAVTAYFRAGDIGSDHYPIIADINRRH